MTTTKAARLERAELLTDRLILIRASQDVVIERLGRLDRQLRCADRKGSTALDMDATDLRVAINTARLERLATGSRAAVHDLRRINLLVGRTEDRLLRLVRGELCSNYRRRRAEERKSS